MDPRADFDAFYREHVSGVRAYFARRVGAERAFDLTAETFAAALSARERFDPARGSGRQWLYGIARHQLQHALERGRSEDRLRERLAVGVPAGEEPAYDDGPGDAEAALAALPEAHREAVRARVVDDEPYDEIARVQGATEAAVRQRVSRGLATLRGRLGVAAVVLAAAAGALALSWPDAEREVPAAPGPAAVVIERTYMGVSCPIPNDVSCDRVGIFVDLQEPAAAVTAEVFGARVALDDPELTRDTAYAGYLEHAGLSGNGPMSVVPRGETRWLGGDDVRVPVMLTVERFDGTRAHVAVEMQLRAGWG